MRTLLKTALEIALDAGGATRLGRRLLRSSTLVLAYHNVVPDGHRPQGDRSLHLPASRFAAQLDELERHVDIVPLADVLNERTGRPGRARVAITFDDGYRGALRHGIRELTRRGLPATVFVCPGLLDGHAFWWDRYAAHPDPSAFRASALEEHRGREDSVCRWAAARGLQAATLPDYMTSASLDELTEAATGSGITVGAHTWTHPNLARATEAELRDELVRTAEWLAESFGDDYRPYLAYPYGLSSPGCEREASDAGYDAALLVRGGWFRADDVDSFAVPRMNVTANVTTRGFRLRLAGVIRR